MRDWRQLWTGLSRRDRRILLLGIALALPLLVWALIWQPLYKAREAARQAHAETAAQHAEVRALAAQLAGRPQPARAAAAQAPLAAVEAAAREQHLLERLKRLEAEDASGVRLMLEDVPADALMRLLEQLERQHGLRVVQAQIEPVASGRVHASLSLSRGSSP